MSEKNHLRFTRIALNNGREIPALGFGTLIPDAAVTISATRDALAAGFRQFDCAERYGNEREVGQALREGLAATGTAREEIFVTTKIWNSNHRAERVEPALEGSLDRLGLKYLDLYLIHTPFAFQAGDNQDPRDKDGNVIYDHGVTLLDTWKALEALVDHGKCRAIGLSDITLEMLQPLYESARIKPAVVQVESQSLPAGNRTGDILQGERHRIPGFRAVRSRDEAGCAGRSSGCGYRHAGWKNAGTSAARLGDTARHRCADHPQNRGARQRELRHLQPSAGRARRNQPDSDAAEAQSGGGHGRAGVYSANQGDGTGWIDRMRAWGRISASRACAIAGLKSSSPRMGEAG